MTQNKKIFINIAVKDLPLSTAFYEGIGFSKIPDFSNDLASCVKWTEDIYFMLLTHNFMKNFIERKEIADMNTVADTIFACMLGSKEEVDEMVTKALAHGGRVYTNPYNEQYDFMYTKSVVDPDGHIIEVGFMDMEKEMSQK
jgi:predicted lactoylglutathione lyase